MANYVCTLDDLPRHQLMATAVLKVAKTMYHALCTLHRANACHCDIKPANIFLDSNGEVFLGDYGSLVFLGSGRQEDALTTPQFTPQEVFRRVPSPSLDFALLAATLADLLGLHVAGRRSLSLYDPDIVLPEDEVYQIIWAKARSGFPPRTQFAASVSVNRSTLSQGSEQGDFSPIL